MIPIPFLRLLCLLLLLSMAGVSRAAELVTATVTLTNNPAGLSSNIVFNGTTHYWTNAPSASLSTLIQTTNTIPLATTNLLNHLSTYPPTFGYYFSQSSPSNVIIRGVPGVTLTITVAPVNGWASVTYATQTVTSATVVRVPLTVEASTNQTNIASLLVKGMSDSSTNSFATNSISVSNLLTKGASPQQYVAGPVQFNGLLRAGAGGGVTNLFVSGGTNVNGTFSNLVNYGNAIRSEGSGGNSLQVGSNALAKGSFSMAIGNSSLASNTSATAIGTGAIATNANSVSIGTAAWAGEDSVSVGSSASANSGGVAIGSVAGAGSNSVALGASSAAGGSTSVAIGEGSAQGYKSTAIGSLSIALAVNGLAIGSDSVANHSNSAAIGPPDHLGTGTTTTTTNQIVLGGANIRTYIPGTFNAVGISNLITITDSTNVIRGDYSTPIASIATIANGANRVNMSTNQVLNLSGAVSATWSLDSLIYGIAEPRDGHCVRLRNNTSYNALINHDSGLEAVAAYRISTPTSASIIFSNSATADLIYSASASRWILWNVFDGHEPSLTATATNAIGFLNGSGTNLNLYQSGSSVALTVNPMISSATNSFQILSTNGGSVLNVTSNGLHYAPGLRLNANSSEDVNRGIYGSWDELLTVSGTFDKSSIVFGSATNSTMAFNGGSSANVLVRTDGNIEIASGGALQFGSRNGAFWTNRPGMTSDFLRMYGTNGVQVFGVDSNGTVYAQATTGRTNNAFEVRATNGAPITYIRSNHTFVASNIVQTTLGGLERGVAIAMFSMTNSTLITNVTVNTGVLSNQAGTFTIPANYLQPGTIIKCEFAGQCSGASATLTNRVTLGGAILATNIVPWASTFANDPWSCSFVIVCRSIGAGGTVFCEGFVTVPTAAAGVASGRRIRLASGAVTVDTTAALALGFDWHPNATATSLQINTGFGVITP